MDSIYYIYDLFLLLGVSIYIYKSRVLLGMKGLWKYKYGLIFVAVLIMKYSMEHRNKWIDNNVLSIILFLNIFILLLIDYNNKNKFNLLHIASIIGIGYLLVTLMFNMFHFKKGKLTNLNKQWLYQYILILTLWIISSNELTNVVKIGGVCLLIYPLLYPLDEYFIHRIFALFTLQCFRILTY